jgi:hypothetical protein
MHVTVSILGNVIGEPCELYETVVVEDFAAGFAVKYSMQPIRGMPFIIALDFKHDTLDRALCTQRDRFTILDRRNCQPLAPSYAACGCDHEGGVAVSSLSASFSPVNSAVVFWETRELHILSSTASGSLLIVLPLQLPQQVWSSHMVNSWCREYYLKYVKHPQALVQVQGTPLPSPYNSNRSLIRLDAENIGDKTSAGASVPHLLPPLYLIFHPKTTGPKPI